MTQPKVLICQPFLWRQPGPYREVLEAAGFEVRFPQDGGKVLSEPQLLAELDGVQATIASTEPYTASLFDQASGLRVVSRTGVGYDSVDVAAATNRGVVVACTPGVNHESV